MKSPFLLMKRSAMSRNQKCSILAYLLVRRLSNVDVENVPHGELILVIEQFTQQLRNSEYDCKEARGHVIDGIRGWKNKLERRKNNRQEFYRIASSTLQTKQSSEQEARRQTRWLETRTERKEKEVQWRKRQEQQEQPRQEDESKRCDVHNTHSAQ